MKIASVITAFGAVAAVAVAFLYATAATAQPIGCAVSLHPSAPSPQLVGERIVWTATAANCGAAPVYQFSVAGPATVRAMVRDFSLDNSFAWAPMVEGGYEVSAKVKDGFDGVTATSAVVSDTVNSRVTGVAAVVTPTLNPLVALYSAPACDSGAIHVRFRPVGGPLNAPWTMTNTLPCVAGLSRNFVVAGMLSNTTYEMVHARGEEQMGSVALFTAGMPPATLSIPTFTVRQAPGPGADLSRSLIYHNLAARPAANAVNLLATDLSARLVWYYDPLASGLIAIGLPGSAPLPNGTVLLGGRDSHRTLGLNVLREIDLAGNPLRETNIDAVNAQLRARGQETIYGFHHEFRRLPNGDIATLGWTQKTIFFGATPEQYAGDMLMVLDENLQVVWTWDAFDHLDVTRGPTLGELCEGAPCPLTGAVDWLHENAVSWSPKDGNLLISVRTQDWVIKINYANGTGDGHVIWRLGKDGDFAVNSSDPDPWFSHQHYPHYLDDSTLVLFDNGNIRQANDPSAHSRGQVWKLDEGAMTATLEFNVDVGNYSGQLGTAERMPNGNYVFNSGARGQSIEVLPDGTKTYVQEVAAQDYRSFRMSSLYQLLTAPNYQGLWWKAPANSESGWGLNLAHQGDTIFASWFTYDTSGKGWWLVATMNKTGDTYGGDLYTVSGARFDAFNPANVKSAKAGTATLTFTDANNGTFSYVIGAVNQSKAITREAFGTIPTCTFGTVSDLATATNYQDLWWNKPANSESGWGINLNHESDTIFATWFTYDTDGTPLWLVVTANKSGTGVYTGDLYRTSGGRYDAFNPGSVTAAIVGTATFTFADGNNATFDYTVKLAGMAAAVHQKKQITREIFTAPGTTCQ